MCDERQREGRIPEISFVLSSLIEVFSCLYEAARQASTDLPACLNPFAAKQQAGASNHYNICHIYSTNLGSIE